MNAPRSEGGRSPEEQFFGSKLEQTSEQQKPVDASEMRARLRVDEALNELRANEEQNVDTKTASFLDPEFVKAPLMRQIEDVEDQMAKLKRGSDEWHKLAEKNNELDKEISHVDRLLAEARETRGEQVDEDEAESSSEAAVDKRTPLAMPESEMLTKQKAFEARQEAFARAKVKAEEMRASYAKPAPAKQPGFFSRVASWWRGATPAQSEAQQKIAQELTPALREQRAPEVQAQQEQARKNAAAYEAQVLSRSRVAKAAEAGSEKEDVAQAAK